MCWDSWSCYQRPQHTTAVESAAPLAFRYSLLASRHSPLASRHSPSFSPLPRSFPISDQRAEGMCLIQRGALLVRYNPSGGTVALFSCGARKDSNAPVMSLDVGEKEDSVWNSVRCGDRREVRSYNRLPISSLLFEGLARVRPNRQFRSEPFIRILSIP